MKPLKQSCGIILSLILFFGCTSDFEIDFQDLSFSKALQKARNQDQMVLVDFYSPT